MINVKRNKNELIINYKSILIYLILLIFITINVICLAKDLIDFSDGWYDISILITITYFILVYIPIILILNTEIKINNDTIMIKTLFSKKIYNLNNVKNVVSYHDGESGWYYIIYFDGKTKIKIPTSFRYKNQITSYFLNHEKLSKKMNALNNY